MLIPWPASNFMKQYDRYLHMSNTNVIIPERANDNASLALSSFIHALHEVESYAVARLVTKETKPPILVLLAPSIEPDYECLIEVQLPFAEDVRSYRFPPLDKIITVSGKVVTEHRNLPSATLKDAMSDYVDSMDLDIKDEDGYVLNLTLYEPTNVFNEPEIQFRVSQSTNPSPHYCTVSTQPFDTAQFTRTIQSSNPQESSLNSLTPQKIASTNPNPTWRS
jgi:hypothetical protein